MTEQYCNRQAVDEHNLPGALLETWLVGNIALLCHTEVMTAWYELAIEVPTEFSDAVASFLFDRGSTGLETVDQPPTTLLKAYFRNVPPIESLQRLCLDLRSTISADWDPVIRSRAIVEENWAENWKEHFRPMHIGDRLYVCPPWNSACPPGRLRLLIHPGMAFGTGQHPTTKGCLELIEATTASMPVAHALDIGTGSGILAIALSKLGARHVWAIDNDRVACRVARENIAANGCLQVVEVTSRWEDVVGTFDLIAANLFTNLLVDLAPRVNTYLREGGAFVCSGFLIDDEAAITTCYRDLGIRHRRVEDGWVTLTMQRTGS